MVPNHRMSRRTLLRGLGTAVALPLFDAMLPRLAVAGLTPDSGRKLPLRLAVVYVPNGKNMKHWTPTKEGVDFELPSVLEPLTEFKQDLLVITGLTCDKARANGDGAGDHARAMSAFLTGRQPKKTAGADIRAGISMDQLAATHVGAETRFRSIEIGCEGGRQAGNCDSGYSCAYSSSISWRGDATPVPKEINPQLLFDRLFGSGKPDEQSAARSKRERYNLSILDLVRDDAKRLHGELGAADQRNLDEYLTSIREVERRVSQGTHDAGPPEVEMARPSGDYQKGAEEFPQYMRLMTEILVLGFQTDQTRIATYVFANEGSTRSYPFVGVPEGHHDLSHHQNNAAKLEKIRLINRFHTTQLAYLLERMKAVKEGDGTLLDHSMVLYGSGNSDGNRHNHDDLPILVAGRANGSITTGRHLRVPKETPLTNLYIEMLDRFGITVERFGDSTGRLTSINV